MKLILGSNMANLIRAKDWQEFTIKGREDKDEDYLFLGGFYNRSGAFFFDNFRLLVENLPNKFNEIPISNGDFEADNFKPHWGYWPKSNGFVPEVTWKIMVPTTPSKPHILSTSVKSFHQSVQSVIQLLLSPI